MTEPARAPAGPDSGGGSPRILVVDDDPDTRNALEKTLRRLGYDVAGAENGEAGLRLALDVRPQVILTDIRMPQMDGHTLLRRLTGHGLDAAVIVMSGNGEMEDVIDVLRNGAVDYVKKPWGPSELIAAVGRAVEIHDQRQGVRRAKGGAPAPEVAVPAAAAPAPETPPIFTAILEQVARGEMTLPPVAAVLLQIRSLIANPRVDMSEMAGLVERDPRLATQVLRIANSAHYLRLGRSRDIATALGRIGFRQLHSLVETVIAHGSHQAGDPALLALQRRIWRYSIARAICMRGLAELVGAQSKVAPETAYLAGLLADAGASFLLWLYDQRVSAGDRPRLDEGSYVLGLRGHHPRVGAGLLGRWGLDPVVVWIAETHHFEAPPAPPSAYWSVAMLASGLADELCGGDDLTRVAPPAPELVDRCGGELRLGAAAVQRIAGSVRREFEGVMEALA